MAEGVKTFNSQDRTVVKTEFAPIPPKDWEGRLMIETAKIAVAPGAGKLPYVTVNIEALDSALKEGGKNRRLFHNFLLSVNGTHTKDSVANVDRQGGLVAFSKAVASPLTGCNVVTKRRTLDDGTEVEEEILDPKQVLQWLQQFGGVVFKFHSRIRAASAGYAAKSELDYFIESDIVNQ